VFCMVAFSVLFLNVSEQFCSFAPTSAVFSCGLKLSVLYRARSCGRKNPDAHHVLVTCR